MRKFCFFFIVSVFLNSVNAQTSIDTIEVTTGWNLIGALYTGATVEIINTIPPNIITSPVYGFIPGGGYFPADTLNLGKGYWVNVNQNGKIIFGTTTTLNCGTISYSGKVYNTVMIGTQCWIKENLDVGTMIHSSQNQSNNGVIEKYCYDNNPNNCIIYGALYQWNEAMQYSTTPGIRGICPPGWRLPTLADFQTLSLTVNNDGNVLKAFGQGSGGGAGTNTTGFSALLTGYMNFDGNFNYLNEVTHFWTSTQSDGTSSYSLHLGSTNNGMFLINYSKNNGFCVRCIKE